jgi:hypothetical protein
MKGNFYIELEITSSSLIEEDVQPVSMDSTINALLMQEDQLQKASCSQMHYDYSEYFLYN